MIVDKEFIGELNQQIYYSLLKIGCINIGGIQNEINITIDRCLDGIKKSICDLPLKENYGGNSKRTKETYGPSQRLIDIENELKRLATALHRTQRETRGRRPREATVLSCSALQLMLGEAPFGDHIIVASRYLVGDRSIDLRLDAPSIVDSSGYIICAEILSNDGKISREQMDRLSMLRGDDGEATAISIVPFTILWPKSFRDHVVRRRRDYPDENLPLAELKEAISSDLHYMCAGLDVALGAIGFVRSAGDIQGTATVEEWSTSEPGYGLIASVLNSVWPFSKGVPGVDRRGALRAEGENSQRSILKDIIFSVIDLVQGHIDYDEAFCDKKYSRIRDPHHFMESDGEYDGKVDAIFSMILSLRCELIAYYVARHTIAGICRSAFHEADERNVRQSAECISGKVLSTLDHRMSICREYYEFGSDTPRGHPLKWFGRFDAAERERWPRAGELATMVFPDPDQDQDHHLDLYTDLIDSLGLGADVDEAWADLTVWARKLCRNKWNVVFPDPDRFDSFSLVSHKD